MQKNEIFLFYLEFVSWLKFWKFNSHLKFKNFQFQVPKKNSKKKSNEFCVFWNFTFINATLIFMFLKIHIQKMAFILHFISRNTFSLYINIIIYSLLFFLSYLYYWTNIFVILQTLIIFFCETFLRKGSMKTLKWINFLSKNEKKKLKIQNTNVL